MCSEERFFFTLDDPLVKFFTFSFHCFPGLFAIGNIGISDLFFLLENYSEE